MPEVAAVASSRPNGSWQPEIFKSRPATINKHAKAPGPMPLQYSADPSDATDQKYQNMLHKDGDSEMPAQARPSHRTS